MRVIFKRVIFPNWRHTCGAILKRDVDASSSHGQQTRWANLSPNCVFLSRLSLMRARNRINSASMRWSSKFAPRSSAYKHCWKIMLSGRHDYATDWKMYRARQVNYSPLVFVKSNNQLTRMFRITNYVNSLN